MPTVADLATRVLQDLKVLQAGETASFDDAELCRKALNDFVDECANDNLTIYTLTRRTWTLTPNVASYTVGLGALINLPRPVNSQMIGDVGYFDTTVTPPVEILLPLLTDDQYQAWPTKAATSAIPGAFYYNPTYPYGTLSPLPVPTGTNTGVIYLPIPVTEFTAVTQLVAVPPGYRRFFRSQVLIEVASAFDATVTQEQKDTARDSKASVRRANQRVNELSCGLAGALFGAGDYDIVSDTSMGGGGGAGGGWTQ